MGQIIRWVLCAGLGLLGAWIILLNFVIVYLWYVRGRHHSWVPLVGGFLCLIGLAVCPLPQVQRWAWVPLAVDVSYCVLVLLIGLVSVCFSRQGDDDIKPDQS